MGNSLEIHSKSTPKTCFDCILKQKTPKISACGGPRPRIAISYKESLSIKFSGIAVFYKKLVIYELSKVGGKHSLADAKDFINFG